MNDAAFNIFVVVAIIFVFVLAWVLVERKRGEQNPVGTGQVKDDVHRIRQRVGEIESSLGSMERDMSDIEGDVDKIKDELKNHPTRSDLARVEGKVDRIYQHLMQKSL